jgi:hypothetical protein
MLIVALFLGVCAVAAGFKAVVASLRHLPRNNEDWVWY